MNYPFNSYGLTRPKHFSKKFPKRSLLPHKHIVPPQTNTIGWDIVDMSSSDRVMCWLHHRHSDLGELTYSDWPSVVWLVMKYSIAVCGLLKCKRVAGPQRLLQCPVLNGKDRRRKLFIIQPLKGVTCLKKEGREWERATDRLIPLCLSIHLVFSRQL